VFENRVLRRIFRLKREEMVRGWRRLHNEELCNLYASLNIIWVTKSRRMRSVGHVQCTGEMRYAYKFWPENLKDVGVDRKIILEWILGK
jgi:hypothetical protein